MKSGLHKVINASRHCYSAGCVVLDGSIHAISIEFTIERAYLRMAAITASGSGKTFCF
jgi:hypothetical protein